LALDTLLQTLFHFCRVQYNPVLTQKLLSQMNSTVTLILQNTCLCST